MNAPWLFAEAYKYRRLRECFSLSKFWVDYGMSQFLYDLIQNALTYRRLLPTKVRHLLAIQPGCL